MKRAAVCLIMMIGLGLDISAKAQSGEVKWSFAAKKIADKTYEIQLTATIQSPWHIYSQTVPEGGPIPTTIIFGKNPMVTLDGKVKEQGKMIEKYEEVFEMKVKYFEHKVTFVQKVKLKGNVKTNLSGTIEYMVCTNEECLPPQDVKFSVALK